MRSLCNTRFLTLRVFQTRAKLHIMRLASTLEVTRLWSNYVIIQGYVAGEVGERDSAVRSQHLYVSPWGWELWGIYLDFGESEQQLETHDLILFSFTECFCFERLTTVTDSRSATISLLGFDIISPFITSWNWLASIFFLCLYSWEIDVFCFCL